MEVSLASALLGPRDPALGSDHEAIQTEALGEQLGDLLPATGPRCLAGGCPLDESQLTPVAQRQAPAVGPLAADQEAAFES